MAIFGFYSVKGGSARTTLAANLAVFVARERRNLRIGLVDCDFEGAGLDLFMATAPAHRIWANGTSPPLLQLSSDLGNIYTQRLAGTLLDVMADGRGAASGTYWLSATEILRLRAPSECYDGINELGDRLWFAPCARDWRKLAKLHFHGGCMEWVHGLVRRMAKENRLDHVFVDCRSGIADSAFTAALAVDCLVMPVVPSNAHLEAAGDGTQAVRDVSAGCSARVHDIQYVASKVPDDPSVKVAIREFFGRERFYQSICRGAVTIVPFHRAMAVAEAMPALSGTGYGEDDEAYRAALGELWQRLEARIETLVPA